MFTGMFADMFTDKIASCEFQLEAHPKDIPPDSRDFYTPSGSLLFEFRILYHHDCGVVCQASLFLYNQGHFYAHTFAIEDVLFFFC